MKNNEGNIEENKDIYKNLTSEIITKALEEVVKKHKDDPRWVTCPGAVWEPILTAQLRILINELEYKYVLYGKPKIK